MGYCIFNNIAIAAKHALERRGLERVAIIDYDVHHGNGTQKAFYDDDRVLFISLHQDSNYPIGSGEGGCWRRSHCCVIAAENSPAPDCHTRSCASRVLLDSSDVN
jgi:acetoin utilization deacetylase AcuC-like enzyme